MRAGALRRRLQANLGAAMRAGDVGAIAMTGDRLKAIAIALAGVPDSAEVDADELAVPTASAAAILGFHPEHVRRLIRSRRLAAARAGRDYRIGLADLWPILEARHRPPGRRRPEAGR
jgi:excisionase family DNA binding protein